MRIVVDTNIAFSAILNTNSKIARILLQPKSRLNFYSTEQLSIEIQNHKTKIKDISNYSDNELDRIITLITNKIRFINLKLIPKESYETAESLTKDVDIDDTEFVALTEHIKGRLWSGDKELQKGLSKKGWNKFITTDDLFERLVRRTK
ncbi:MAG: PIN domain-containing protein [Tenuifilaceae bacterium]|jgi:predicted nucleic acid-binding protein|uniref:PIN domain-containing protein n=1 Tax=Perlabentimonas gracilis TaxID=2715279 RepID=UPI00140A74C1|nr:PIN domain-containing protein [Perlabentimonas gracilis]MDX9770561.1 PIN domain-containing protein [Tenuifilaceae bacterium]NHB68501.1 DNA-binding protein [Perlabentimonas gracilis]